MITTDDARPDFWGGRQIGKGNSPHTPAISRGLKQNLKNLTSSTSPYPGSDAQFRQTHHHHYYHHHQQTIPVNSGCFVLVPLRKRSGFLRVKRGKTIVCPLCFPAYTHRPHSGSVGFLWLLQIIFTVNELLICKAVVKIY